jgi:hypothetical protein
MKKNLLIAIALAFVADVVQAQNTTYGGDDARFNVDAGYVSDYSPNGTIVLPNGSVTLTNATYEHGNNLLQNDGSWTATGGLDLFLAGSSNTISGSTAPSFFNVQFNIGAGNTMAITNAQGINIAGNLQFNNGLTTTIRNNSNAGALHFADGATYTGGTTDAQHVDGYVSKTGNDAFTFPVGSGSDLRTLSISAPAGAATISTAWFAGSPATVTDPSDGVTHSVTAVADPAISISTAGFWDWINPAGSNDNIAVTVSIPDVSGFALPENLRLVGWDGVKWVALSGGGASAATENSALSGIIPAGVSITALAIGGFDKLPVTLVSFTGKAVEKTVALKWITTEEINASHFEVQRSGDARNFEPIAEVDAKGESKVVVEYTFADQTPLPGTNYYRLKQIDLDGSYAFSKTISVLYDAKIKINIYPNPVTDVLRIESSAGLQSVEIFGVDGSKVTGTAVPAGNASAATSNFREISLRDQKPGIYVLVVDGRSFKVLKN